VQGEIRHAKLYFGYPIEKYGIFRVHFFGRIKLLIYKSNYN